MLSFDEKEEARMEQEAFESSLTEMVRANRTPQIVVVTADEYARAAQYKALLIALRTASGGERYDLEKVAIHVVDTFNELEGAGC